MDRIFALVAFELACLAFHSFAFEVVVNRSDYAGRQSFSTPESPRGQTSSSISMVVKDILREIEVNRNKVEVQDILLANFEKRSGFEVGQILGELLANGVSIDVPKILKELLASKDSIQISEILEGMLVDRTEAELVQIVKIASETKVGSIQVKILEAIVEKYPKINVYDILKQASKNKVNVDFMNCLKSGKLFWLAKAIRTAEANEDYGYANKLKVIFNQHVLEWINSDEDNSIPSDGIIE